MRLILAYIVLAILVIVLVGGIVGFLYLLYNFNSG